MSPEFQNFISNLNNIEKREQSPIEVVFREDTRKSDKEHTSYVLYLWYEDNWEYHWFYFPKREAILAEIEFDEFKNHVL